MEIKVLPMNRETLVGYSTITSYLKVESLLEVKVLDDGFGGMAFKEKKIARPYKKDYREAGEPFSWLNFNTSNWVMFVIQSGERPIGGLVVACKTPELRMLNGRNDLADVWDIRVHPDFQGKGVGTKLFTKAVEWSRKEGYKQLCVETQNVNVPACRFYIKQGCVLGGVNRYAYYATPAFAEEVQLIWFMDL
jgi:streptothricin acetyltransferase